MRFLLLLALLLPAAPALALTCTSQSTGTWFAAARWSCGRIPTAVDDVVVQHNPVSIDSNNAVAQSVTVIDPAGGNVGVLQFNSTTARTLAVSRASGGTGNVTVNLGASFTVANVTQSGHVLRLDGDLTNNGTFNMAIDGNSRAIVEFNRAGAQTLSGTGGTTNFQQIRLAKASSANVLNVTGLSNLTFTNGLAPNVSTTTGGTFRIASALTLSNLVNNTLPANLVLLVDHASATLNNPATLTVSSGGTLQVDDGTFAAGTNLNPAGTVLINGGIATVAGTSTITGTLEAAGGTTTITGNVTLNSPGTLTVSGGTLNMNGGTGVTINTGATMLVTAGVANVGDEIFVNAGALQIDNGTVNVGNAANERVVLNSNAATTFAMSGGALNIAGAFTSNNVASLGTFTLTNGAITVGTVGNSTNNALNAPFFVGSGTQFNFSGGTVVIQNDNTGGNAREYDVRATSSTVTGGTVQIGNASTPGGEVFQVNSVPPVPNFTVNATGDPAVTLIAALSVARNWTYDSTGAFTHGSFTVTMSGSVAQTIGGAQSTTFSGLTIANTSGGVSLTADQTVSGTLTLSSGTLAVGANTLTLTGPAIAGTPANLTTTSASSLVFGGSAAGHNLPSSVLALSNLTLNNANGLALNSDPVLAGTLTLTSGAISTGSNVIATSASCTTPSVVRTAGRVAGNLRLAFPGGASSCTFPIGDATTNYTPLQVDFAAGAVAGSVTASVVNADHPNSSAGINGVLGSTGVNRYWTLRDSSVAGPATLTFTYVAADNDGGTAPGSYRIVRGAGCSGSTTTRTCTPWRLQTVSGTPTTTSAVASGVAVSADSPAQADFVIGNADPSTNLQREKQFIYTRERY